MNSHDKINLGFMDFDRRAIPAGDKAFAQMLMNNRLLWLQLVGMNPLPMGEFATTLLGSAIPLLPLWAPPIVPLYTSLYKNNESNLVGLVIGGQFAGAPGKQVKLSLSGDSSDEQVVDYLGDTPSAPSFNKRFSATIVLAPKQELFIAYAADPAVFPCTAATKFTVKVFNPARYLNDVKWEAR
jgi:hypothetical protein